MKIKNEYFEVNLKGAYGVDYVIDIISIDECYSIDETLQDVITYLCVNSHIDYYDYVELHKIDDNKYTLTTYENEVLTSE